MTSVSVKTTSTPLVRFGVELWHSLSYTNEATEVEPAFYVLETLNGHGTSYHEGLAG